MSRVVDDLPIPARVLTAGVAGCCAEYVTFPLDTAKVRLMVDGQAQSLKGRYKGLFGTLIGIARQEGPLALYNGLNAGLQRQICFSSVRIGLYEPVKAYYQYQIAGANSMDKPSFWVRLAAGTTTGALSALVGQPTDVVKIRLQAQGGSRYSSTWLAYKTIYTLEGIPGLWKGIYPNMGRNAVVNVGEMVCYDVVKDAILSRNLLKDDIPCHFVSATIAGFCATVAGSPIDVVKTIYMNSAEGEYRGAIDCAIKMMVNEGPFAFYKGWNKKVNEIRGRRM